MREDELQERFRQLRATSDPKLREELVAEFTRLANYFARRYDHRGVPRDDLKQVAMLGLLHAIDRFDPDFGTRFASFAGRTIDSELKRHFRDHTWSVRMPRRMQELHLRARGVSETLVQALGRSPTVAELAAEMGVELDEAVAALDAGTAYRADSLDRPAPGDDEPGCEPALPDGDAAFIDVEHRSVMADLLATLPERERHILRLRFYDELSQSEIADRLGISQMHVSRLLRRSVEQLRLRQVD